MVIEADELWSFVGSKAGVPWVWVALDAGTRRVLAMVVGDRSAGAAQRLWDAPPRGYRTGATVYADVRASYRAVIHAPDTGRWARAPGSPRTSSDSG